MSLSVKEICKEIDHLKSKIIVLQNEVNTIESFGYNISKDAFNKYSKPSPSYKDCVLEFMSFNEGEFSPSKLVEFVAQKRGKKDASTRVYVQRIIKEMVLEGKILQVEHGKYKEKKEI